MSNHQAEALPQSFHTTPYPPSIERAVGPPGADRSIEPGPFSELASLCPVGALDSGMGGLSIVTGIRRELPHEDVIFYADNANCPYGGRSDEWLRNRSLEVAQFLLERGAKAIVVACNTASAAGLEHLRATFRVPIVGLVPAVKPAVAATRTGVIGVFATPATIRGSLLTDVVERFAAPADVQVVTVAPVGFVEAVERGDLGTAETAELVREAIEPMISKGADAIVLGSTHYPFLKPIIGEIVGDSVKLIDSAEGVARQTRRVLEARQLLRKDEHAGALSVYTSADPEAVRPLVWRLIGEEVMVLQG